MGSELGITKLLSDSKYLTVSIDQLVYIASQEKFERVIFDNGTLMRSMYRYRKMGNKEEKIKWTER